jgi:enterochelin esterase-like enzyme
LNREVKISIISPKEKVPKNPMSVLFVFDGQDFPALGMLKTVDKFLSSTTESVVLVVGVHANQDRLIEYGTSSQPDYANRGRKATQTTEFIIQELIPYIEFHYKVSQDRKDWFIAGFSLGGLMAMDIAWNHSDYFSKAGVFSGSFWWRQRDLKDDYDEMDRIMHKIIRTTPGHPEVKFWFETGTNDEKDDRDNDGIIDSIDDTLDLIAELERKGYQWGKDIHYVEVKEGEHNPSTWGKVFPDFLNWALK